MKVIFIIEPGAYEIVKHCLKNDIGDVKLGEIINLSNTILNCIIVFGYVYNEEFKQFILSDSVHIKGLRDIYVKPSKEKES